jgi:hypothetical protein
MFWYRCSTPVVCPPGRHCPTPIITASLPRFFSESSRYFGEVTALRRRPCRGTSSPLATVAGDGARELHLQFPNSSNSTLPFTLESNQLYKSPFPLLQTLPSTHYSLSDRPDVDNRLHSFCRAHPFRPSFFVCRLFPVLYSFPSALVPLFVVVAGSKSVMRST